MGRAVTWSEGKGGYSEGWERVAWPMQSAVVSVWESRIMGLTCQRLNHGRWICFKQMKYSKITEFSQNKIVRESVKIEMMGFSVRPPSS